MGTKSTDTKILGIHWNEDEGTYQLRYLNPKKNIQSVFSYLAPLPDANINHADIHVFGDSSIMGTCAVAYAVVFQPNGTQQNIIASKSRLAEQQLSIPSLELVATHMAANLTDNIKIALENLNIRNVFGWTDSTVVLHWLEKNGDYNQFVNNRVDKIKEKDYITWRHVPTNEDPADIGSKGVYRN